MIKLFISDLDGTLFTSPENYISGISEDNLKAIMKLKSKGVMFGIATGRNHSFFLKYPIHRMLEPIIIANNGSYIFYENNIVYKNEFSVSEVIRLIDENPDLKDKLVFKTIENKAIFCSHRGKKEFFKGDNKDMNIDGVIENNSFKELINKEPSVVITHIFVFFNDTQTTLKYEKILKSKYRKKYFIVKTDKEEQAKTLNFIKCENGKASGLIKLLKLIRITPNDVAVIGDSYNDIDLFQLVEKSFCMEIADDNVKRYANKTVKSVSEAVSILEQNGYV